MKLVVEVSLVGSVFYFCIRFFLVVSWFEKVLFVFLVIFFYRWYV